MVETLSQALGDPRAWPSQLDGNSNYSNRLQTVARLGISAVARIPVAAQSEELANSAAITTCY